MDRETVKRAADFARIRLDDSEVTAFKEETDKLLAIVDTMNDAPACDNFCFEPIGLSDALRDDIPIVDSTVEELLGSMGTYDGYVRGPKIV